MDFKSLKDSITKKAKGIHVSVMSDSDIAKRDEWLPTPALDLNRILSGNLKNGLPLKTWTLIVGPEHSFKSSFMCLTMAEAQKKGMNIIVIDTEGAWDHAFVRRWGLDPEKILYIYSPWLEDISVALAQILESEEENFAIVLDSIGGIAKRKVFDDALEGTPKQDQGGLQKDLKSLYKLLLNIVKSKKSVAVAAGHLFGNPGSYGGADEIGGGKAAKLLPDVIVSLKKSKIFDSEKNVIGNEIRAITMKNRIYPPFNEATIQINYKDGINKYAGLGDIAVKAGLITKGGAGWYTYIDKNGEEQKYQGDIKLNTLFEKNEDELIERLNEYITKCGFSTVNDSVKEAVELLENVEENVEDKIEDSQTKKSSRKK